MQHNHNGPLSLEGMFEAFAQEMQYRGNSAQTIAWYRKVFTFLRESGVRQPGDLTRQGVMRFIVGAQQRGLASATVKNYDRALRGLLNWWHRNGYLAENPMTALPRPRGQDHKVQPFTPQEVDVLLKAAKDSERPLRNTALLLTLLDTGIRSGEACNLTLRDVNWTEGLLRVNGKTGERLVPFGQRTHRALQAYLNRERRAEAPEVQHVFLSGGHPMASTNLNPIVTKLARRGGLTRPKVGPHTCRHYFATSYLKAGGDVFTLQRILGHRKLEITQGYVALMTEDIRAAHRRFSPIDPM